jgi:hypothetical protein
MVTYIKKNPVPTVYHTVVPRQLYQGLCHAACQVFLTETVLQMAEADMR